MTKHSDEYWMNIAIDAGRKAAQQGEVPIGACLVKDDKLVCIAHNLTGELKNGLAHAEKLAIEEVIRAGEKFLYDYTLYVTVEPCLMCAGVIIWSRVGKVVFGCYDEKAGAAGSVYNALQDKNFNYSPTLISGVLQEECRQLMVDYFKQKRT